MILFQRGSDELCDSMPLFLARDHILSLLFACDGISAHRCICLVSGSSFLNSGNQLLYRLNFASTVLARVLRAKNSFGHANVDQKPAIMSS
jgi:hypothetical protein